jgi:tetratricopeptide (TPR) repeat protein
MRDAFSLYLQARRRAEDQESSAESWHAAAAAGTRLVEYPNASQLPFALDDLRAEVAQCWNQLGYILSDEQKKPQEALAAFEEAVRLCPDFAMYWRNHASTNIDLGNLDAAAVSLARAGELEPDHPRLAELRRELDEARKKLAGESSDFQSL